MSVKTVALLAAVSSLFACKPRLEGSATKDAFVATGTDESGKQTFSLFMADNENGRTCVVKCTDYNPKVVHPEKDGTWKDRLNCDIDMMCLDTTEAIADYIKNSTPNNDTDPLVASILGNGFAVKVGSDASQSVVALANQITKNIQDKGKKEPVSEALADKYLNRSFDGHYNISSDPQEQQRIDAFIKSTTAARDAERQKIEQEAEALRQKAVEKGRAYNIEYLKKDIPQIKANIEKFDSLDTVCPASSWAKPGYNENFGWGGGETYHFRDGDCNCLSKLMLWRSTSGIEEFSFVFKRPDTFVTGDDDYKGFIKADGKLSISYRDCYFAVGDGLGNDTDGYTQIMSPRDSIWFIENIGSKPTAGFTWTLKSHQPVVTMADGKRRAPWEIYCSMEGTDVKKDPICTLTLNKSRGNRNRPAVPIAPAYTKDGMRVPSEDDPVATRDRPLRFVASYKFDGKSLSLNFNPEWKKIRWISFAAGPKCLSAYKAAGREGMSISFNVKSGNNLVLTSMEKQPTAKYGAQQVLLLDKIYDGINLSSVTVNSPDGIPCDDLMFLSWP